MSLHGKEILGSGSYGTVYKVDGAAVKVFTELDVSVTECALMHLLSCKHVVGLLRAEVNTGPRPLSLYLELYDMSLAKWLLETSRERVSAGLLLHILGSVALGLHYIHSAGVIHGDIKPANVLLKACAESPHGLRVAICDFSASHPIGVNYTTVQTEGYRAPEVGLERGEASSHWALGAPLEELGEPFYLPFYHLGGSRYFAYSEKIDVWSYGMLALRLTTRAGMLGCGPADESNCVNIGYLFRREKGAHLNVAVTSLIQKEYQGYLIEPLSKPPINQLLLDLIMGCLRVVPRDRFTSRDCVEMLGLTPVFAEETLDSYLRRLPVRIAYGVLSAMTSEHGDKKTLEYLCGLISSGPSSYTPSHI